MNKMQWMTRTVLLSSAIFLMACDQKNTENTEPSPDSSASEQVMKELQTDPVKAFPQTADDPHDIAVLTDYELRFQEMSADLEAEMNQMRKDENLTEEFIQQRQRDHVRSALNMLKALELKTEQGRYIQGLMYQYWEHQEQLLKRSERQASTVTEASKNVQGLGKYLHAQEQLEHWRLQYPQNTQPPAKITQN
ncbi:hypothetical protein OC498_12325 [Acinetobacter bohemicus]|uniref:hypothetical protein n=1 Tax=Acinetobacter TaxID=469 RepID=UPI001191BEC7|nr:MULTISPECIES: hypothetical protein [Acinetobacter]MCO8041369.1 hypothetical protein [Acinetobacter sp. S4400-12]MCU7225673.1 hypothetical protein [Acinetobacter bohemicus]TSH68859.1 hypothetical protein E2K73_13530 [Acinetobacter sp. RF15A]TSI14470.1 hypothetical protein E2K74_13680 [Acinetobacter sp. RF15B]